MVASVGRLRRVALREVWPHEALDFTKWLGENLDVLNEVLGLNLQNPESEQAAGDFRVDVVAEEADGTLVVIENQLGQSDHDHLGKIITYLTGLEAKKAIWIVADPRPEHVAAISWLNSESSTAKFYLVKVEAVRIGTSEPAPLLTKIVAPSTEPSIKQELTERHTLRYRFWASLLEAAKPRSRLFANISPGTDNWMGAGAGKSGVWYQYVIRQHDATVCLYMSRGRLEENRLIFDALHESKDSIEATFGEPLDWVKREDRQTCEIRKVIPGGGYRDDEDAWSAIQDRMIDSMTRLETALRPFIARLPV